MSHRDYRDLRLSKTTKDLSEKKEIELRREPLKMLENERKLFERLRQDGYSEEQAWSITMTRIGKEGNEIDTAGNESELFVKKIKEKEAKDSFK